MLRVGVSDEAALSFGERDVSYREGASPVDRRAAVGRAWPFADATSLTGAPGWSNFPVTSGATTFLEKCRPIEPMWSPTLPSRSHLLS